MAVHLKSSDVYSIAYRMIGDLTPIYRKDCGVLCDGACCKGDDETGMYLYPFEEAMFSEKNAWYRIIASDFTYDDTRVNILTCPGKCVRDERPLACRIFPLAPYQKKKGDKLKIIVDPRSFSVCPLSKREYARYIDSGFHHRVERTFRFLNMFEPIHRFIEEMSYQMDEYNRFFVDDTTKK